MNEADVEAAFVSYMIERGWDAATANTDHTDMIAKRGAERLLVKGHTAAPGPDVDTMYGQILRRMRPDLGDEVRFAVAVPESMAAAVQRVPAHVRRVLDLDVYLVSDLGDVRELKDQMF